MTISHLFGSEKIDIIGRDATRILPRASPATPIPSDTHNKNLRLTKVIIGSMAIPATVTALYHCLLCHFHNTGSQPPSWKCVTSSISN